VANICGGSEEVMLGRYIFQHNVLGLYWTKFQVFNTRKKLELSQIFIRRKIELTLFIRKTTPKNHITLAINWTTQRG
jgi:hypothetical protein